MAMAIDSTIRNLSILCIFLVCIALPLQSEGCKCTLQPTTLTSSPSLDPVVTSSDQIYNNTNYGKLGYFNSTFWLLKDITVTRSIYSFTDPCPEGFHIPTVDDLNSIIGMNNLSGVFSMNTSRYYVSNSKPYKVIANGGESTDWSFWSIKWSNGGIPLLVNDSTYWITPDKLVTRCVSSLTYPLVLSGLSPTILNSKSEYTLSVPGGVGVEYEWIFPSGTITTPTARKVFSDGCNTFSVHVKLFSGHVISNCLSKYSYMSHIIQSDSEIETFTFPNILVNNVKGIHFSSGAAPISVVDPTSSGNDGAYVLYSELDTNAVKLLKIDNNIQQVGEPIHLRYIPTNSTPSTSEGYAYAKPFDFTVTPNGIVSLLYNGSHLFLLASNFDGTQRWYLTIMNNGASPDGLGTDQIWLLDSSTKKPMFGTNAMWKPNNGRLLYTNNRIMAIFAHYNNFGNITVRNDHTGDTLITLDESTGGSMRVSFSWGSSHSLLQSVVFDGNKFVGSSLGDAYPQNLYTYAVEEFNPVQTGFNIKYTSNSELVSGLIPGDVGYTCGRLGGVHHTYNDRFLVIYSRAAVSIGSGSNNVEEFALIVFDSKFKIWKKKVIAGFGDVNVIHSAKYGPDILIAYTRTTRKGGYGTNAGKFPAADTNVQDTMYITQIDVNGNILIPPFAVSNYSMNASDDWKTLHTLTGGTNGGAVLWTFVDHNTNRLNIKRIKRGEPNNNLVFDEGSGAAMLMNPSVLMVSLVVIISVVLAL
eukprot:TRINITY_DN11174_c0_g1_i1.p1 TRINITY_DN11174_c0_g1~~TRINITY_DN11174_c0_g1_i1.p1  ORF type:complete len:752 (-),score=172.94 TRINITY_DN11174_c0_g1_i1:35-2290(-)